MQYSEYAVGRVLKYRFFDDRGFCENYIRQGMHRHSAPPKKIPLILSKPTFMPNYLVRTCDMKVVKGSEVQEGYCTLSYSWNQSGEILLDETTGKSYRIDQGKHKIIFPGKTVRKKPRGRKRIPGKVKFVKFEELIQEICKDFNIKYIWYDQMCINQNHEEEKHDEIKQMHKIYGNAYCTLALVPELTTVLSEPSPGMPLGGAFMDQDCWQKAEWMKRMWTLEEAVMSSTLLFVGPNVHCWSYWLMQADFPVFHKNVDTDVATLLHYAHTRTSTKDHDHIFALANIFPDIIKEIEIDYKQDIQELMVKFYGLLIKKDLGVLCFRPFSKSKKDNETNVVEYNSPMQKFDLPSWTGIDGEHFKYGYYKTAFTNYAISGRALQVTCRGMTNKQCYSEISSIASIKPEDIPPYPQSKSSKYYEYWILVISTWSPSFMQEKFIGIYSPPLEFTEIDSKIHEEIIQKLRNISHFISIKEMNIQWVRSPCEIPISYLVFDDLSETLQDSEEYVILPELRFTNHFFQSTPNYSVIKKNGDHYKVVGMVQTGQDEYLFDDFATEEQMFEIH
ncbi:hypothetical protein INT45_004619 [Circinella minor]|uniref:Heterokaryon incompatibility domain-containing protein n=1 Tax=Circinella minor TaxID=1195481 RepID=A0A8H7VHS3_9FUNG|nr:hypothetical protein INT45_004619 [Circinella minor]